MQKCKKRGFLYHYSGTTKFTALQIENVPLWDMIDENGLTMMLKNFDAYKLLKKCRIFLQEDLQE